MKKKILNYKDRKVLKAFKEIDMTDMNEYVMKRQVEGIGEEDPFNQKDRNPTNEWYRPADIDDFPSGPYIAYRSGRPLSHYYRLGDTSHQMSLTPSAIEEVIKHFSFKKIFSCDAYSPDYGAVLSRRTYEISDDTGGVLLLNVGGFPTFLTGKKKKQSGKEPNNIMVSIMSNVEESLYNSVMEFIIKKYTKKLIPINNVNLVISSQHGYDTEPFELPKQKIDIELNYGKQFAPIHKKIIDTLNTPNGKGLVLLHGTPGTGKTHYLKYLASRIKGKKVLFIPPYLADFITSPDMTPFLIDNSDSVLFIEDAERVITDRSESGSNGVSNILNITDGILSDILKIQIVATFNMDRQKIDPALLRKGRLIAEHKFEALPVDESNLLLKHLSIDHTTKDPMTLTEIYNYKDTHYVSEDGKGKNKIGFGSR